MLVGVQRGGRRRGGVSVLFACGMMTVCSWKSLLNFWAAGLLLSVSDRCGTSSRRVMVPGEQQRHKRSKKK